MPQDQAQNRGLPAFFGELGYTIVCVIAVGAAVEFLSYLAMAHFLAPQPFYAGRCRGTAGGKCPAMQEDVNINSAGSVYEKYPWAEDFWREEHQHWRQAKFRFRPFVAWDNAAWQGRYWHFDRTATGIIRRTANPQANCATTVWMFGGSTMMGQGSPDDMTIASYLSSELNAAPGTCVTVINRGVDAYNSNQETILLLQLLKAGERPSLVIFYDGVNEAVVGLWTADGWNSHGDVPRMRQLLENATLSSSVRSVLLDSYSVACARWFLAKFAPAPGAYAANPALPGKILDNYAANMRIIRMIAREYGFPVAFFWQPDIYFGSKPHDWFENGVVKNQPDNGGEFAGVFREAERRAAAGPAAGQYVFLGHIFDDVRDPLYIDTYHIGPEGNRMVARRIAETIRAPGWLAPKP